MDFRSGCGVGAKAPTPVTVRLAPQCADLPAAGRTTSFRRLSLRRRLVCRAGQSSRTKDGRQSCPTRRERARSSKEPTDERQKAATSPAQPRLQGQKISRTNRRLGHPGRVSSPHRVAHPGRVSSPRGRTSPPGGSATYTRGPHTPRRFLTLVGALILVGLSGALTRLRDTSVLRFKRQK